MENATGQRIRELRAEKGITQSELAEMLDKTCGAPRMWELGKAMPDAATIKKLADYFDCSSDYLLNISDFRTEKEKIEFIDAEKAFYENLNRLKEQDKVYLIESLNCFISIYKETEDENGFDFKLLAEMIDSLALMLAEIKAAAARHGCGHDEGENVATEKSCEANAGGVLCFGTLKLKAGEALDGICRHLLSVYLKVIKG